MQNQFDQVALKDAFYKKWYEIHSVKRFNRMLNEIMEYTVLEENDPYYYDELDDELIEQIRLSSDWYEFDAYIESYRDWL